MMLSLMIGSEWVDSDTDGYGDNIDAFPMKTHNGRILIQMVLAIITLVLKEMIVSTSLELLTKTAYSDV